MVGSGSPWDHTTAYKRVVTRFGVTRHLEILVNEMRIVSASCSLPLSSCSIFVFYHAMCQVCYQDHVVNLLASQSNNEHFTFDIAFINIIIDTVPKVAGYSVHLYEHFQSTILKYFLTAIS